MLGRLCVFELSEFGGRARGPSQKLLCRIQIVICRFDSDYALFDILPVRSMQYGLLAVRCSHFP